MTLSVIHDQASAMTDPTNPGIPALVHLSGPLRGTAHALRASRLRLGTSPAAEIGFPTDAVAVRERHAVLERSGEGYRIRASGGAIVRVNGTAVDRRPLRPEDVIELGDGGPLLRYRIRARAGAPHKSISEAFRDCVDRARHGSDTAWGRAALFLESLPRQLLTQTAPWPRTLILVVLVGLVTSTALLAVRSWRLERRLEAEAERLHAATRLLEEAERSRLAPDELERIRAELAGNLSERLSALEARREAVPAVIETASRSVAFVQGAYGFLDPESGRPLRTVVGPDGRPQADARGQPIVSPDADGPVLEMRFSGTAFVADEGGLLLTNRHLARPWEFDATARAAVDRGLVPTMRRMVGYLPEVEEPFPVEPVAASQEADLAVLRAAGPVESAARLELDTLAPRPGQEVVVLGYPAGIRALLARTNPSFVDSLRLERALDFWTVARRLSAGGHIAPLATRGIVGQATRAFVVYDAETTRGGSGGPVLSLDGRVLAVTVGILPEFGGSNLGVPADEARRLLAAAADSASTEAGEAGGDQGADDVGEGDAETERPPLQAAGQPDSLPDHERD